MTKDTETVIKLVDALDYIRRRPYHFFWGGIASPDNILSNFVPYLSALSCLPISIDRRGDWWLVSATQDWMVGAEPEALFSRICSDPRLGVNSYRPEILIPAFSEAIFTSSKSGFAWIKPTRVPVPADLEKPFAGRLVGFLDFKALPPVTPPA